MTNTSKIGIIICICLIVMCILCVGKGCVDIISDVDTSTDYPEISQATVEDSAKIKSVKETNTIPSPTKTPEPKTEYTFSSGNFKSGRDFKPGTYDIIAVKGHGNVSSDNWIGGINAIMGVKADEMYEKEYKNIELPKDVTLTITGVTVKLIKK